MIPNPYIRQEKKIQVIKFKTRSLNFVSLFSWINTPIRNEIIMFVLKCLFGWRWPMIDHALVEAYDNRVFVDLEHL